MLDLDALFNELAADTPRLLFTGGTSLSTCVSLIERFSEDLNITVFRNGLNEPAWVEEVEALSGKKGRARLAPSRVLAKHCSPALCSTS